MGRRERNIEGSRLRDARRNLGLSLSDFASKLGYSRSYLSAVELGHLPETEQIVMAYETALNLDRGSLQTGKQSVARVLHRMGVLGNESLDPPIIEQYHPPLERMTVVTSTDVIRSVLALLVEAARIDVPPGEIVLTSFAESDRLSSSESLHQQWISAQQVLLSRGWSITHVVRLNDNVERSLRLVERMLPLLVHPAGFHPLFAGGSEPLPGLHDIFLVPGVGALLALSTLTEGQEALLFVRDSKAVQAISENCSLLKSGAKPLIEPVSREDGGTFARLLNEIENTPGDRFLVRDAMHRWPNQAWDSDVWLPSIPMMDEPAQHDAQFLSLQQTDAFMANARRFRHRDIAMKTRLEEVAKTTLLVQQGLLLSEGAEQFQPQVFIAQVRSSIEALRSLPNYELALLDADEVELIQAERTQSVVYWLVKGGKELLLESWPRVQTGESRHLHFAVHEASIATAFQEHFKNIWNRITPRNRDKDYVIWWLERLLEPIEASGI